jgi:putative ABC transport system ATP-binding protein
VSSFEPSLSGIQLSKSFGEGDTLTPAVRQVSVSLAPGEFCLVMGPSGCGKSTLLAMLSGLLRPDEGRVLALGEDLWALSDHDRRDFRLRQCGYVFQGYNLFPALTAREQLEMVLRWGEGTGPREARRRVGEMLDLLGLANKGGKVPAQLSGGEKQRVAIGRALIKKPLLCFADEPTSALDWAHGQQIVKLLSDLTRQLGSTAVVVSHDHRLMKYADQVIHLDDGRLVSPDPETSQEPAALAAGASPGSSGQRPTPAGLSGR